MKGFFKVAVMPTSFQMAAVSMLSSQYPFQNLHNLSGPTVFHLRTQKTVNAYLKSTVDVVPQ